MLFRGEPLPAAEQVGNRHGNAVDRSLRVFNAPALCRAACKLFRHE